MSVYRGSSRIFSKIFRFGPRGPAAPAERVLPFFQAAARAIGPGSAGAAARAVGTGSTGAAARAWGQLRRALPGPAPLLALFLALACLPAAYAGAAESNSGAVSFQGGENTTGIYNSYGPAGHVTAGDFTNSGALTATGGPGGALDGADYYYGGTGLDVGGDFTNSGTVYGYGGNNGSGEHAIGGSGLHVRGAFSNSGRVYAYGGDDSEALSGPAGSHGLRVEGAFSNSGAVYAYGGRAARLTGNVGYIGQAGLQVDGSFSNSGSVHAHGGEGYFVLDPADGSASGTLGGIGLRVEGDFTNSGTVSAQGGYNNGGNGLGVHGTFHNHGIVHAQGGTLSNRPGVGAKVFINRGTVYGQGGTTETYGGAIANHGLSTSAFSNHGLAAFRGGTRSEWTFINEGNDAYVGFGLFSQGTARNHGDLALFSGPQAYAVGIYPGMSTSTFVLASGSRLLAGPGQYAGINAHAGGGEAQNVAIEDGARFQSLATGGLAPGQSYTHRLVVKANQVSGDFAPHDGPVLSYAFAQSGASPDVEYTATVTRKAHASDFAAGHGALLASGLERAFAASEPGMDNLHWAMLLADLEHQPDAASVRSAASGAAPRVLPLDTAQGVRSLVRGARLADGVASARLRAFGKGAPGAELGRFVAASNALVPGYFAPATAAAPGDDGEGAVGRFGLWLQPFASWGEQRGGRGYNDLDEKYRGASLGLAWDSGPLVFSLSGHYVGAELDASGYEAEADALGLTLGLGRQFRVNDSFAPWAELRLGWTAYELDQQRRDHGGDQVYSSPDVNVYSAGLLADNDFTFGSVTLTPHLALDYAHLDMDAYAERGGNYALRVDPKDYQSLRGTAGLAAAWQATEALALKGRAAWHLEMKDKRGELRTSAVTLPSLDLTTRGEDLDRSSGTLGAGFLWQPGRNVSVGMDYDFAFGERYSGHTVSGVLKVSF